MTRFSLISTNTDSENGLKGIAFDPSYATNGFVYVYYTDDVTLKNRISRFTVSADPDVADPNSERVLVDDIVTGIYRNGGALHFGPDGKLYISVGDASYAPNAQLFTNLNGKIVRINKDGSIPADNPFVGQAGARTEIWALGLRNPFTFAFDPGSSRMYINDVGQVTWEELNSGQSGANFGWPHCEGVCADPRYVNPIYTYNHDAGPGKSITGAAFYRGSMFPADYGGDYFFGDYVGNYIRRFDVATQQVTDFAVDASNPVDLDVGPDGALYYLSVEAKQVHRIAYGEAPPPPPDPDGNLVANAGFEMTSGWPSPWFLNVRSPAAATVTRVTDSVRAGTSAARVNVSAANLDWYVQLNQGGISLDPSREHTLNFAARAATPRSIRVTLHRNSAPYPVYVERTFELTTNWATYSFDFIPPATASQTLLSVNLGSIAGQVWLDEFTLTPGDNVADLPVPVIDLPAAGTTYRAGDQINFSGRASDPQQGNLSPSALLWEVVFHHDTHTHPFVEPFSGTSSGSFVIPDTGETSANTWYRIHLTAADSQGHTSEVTRDVRPRTATVTLATQPAALGLTLDGSPMTTPRTFTGVVGFKRDVGAPLTQTIGGVTYRFVSWSDGGAATHTIVTPASTATYTATYVADTTLVNAGFEQIGSGWLNPWAFKVRAPAAATVARDTTTKQAGSASGRINITTASQDWHVQLLQPNVPLVAGQPHTLSFWARSSNAARVLRVGFQRNSAPYPLYFERSFPIGMAWARYSVTFTPGSSDSRSLFSVNLGANTGQVWLDSFALAR